MNQTNKNQKFTLKNIFITYSVPILFVIVCLGGYAISGLQGTYVLNEIMSRIGRNMILVLSLIIPVLAGMGLNFALVIGAMAGQVALIIVKLMNLQGIVALLMAFVIATPFAIIFGLATGVLLNKTKGREMITSLILGYFANGLYQLVFLLLVGTVIPIKNAEIILDGGIGLKNSIDLKFMQYSLDRLVDNIFGVDIILGGVRIPVATLFVILLVCLFTMFIVRTKLGQNFRALGQDLKIAKISGINTDKTRLIAITMSITLAAWGQIIFLQNIGTLNTYASHEQVGMFAVAAILIGGASVTKATISEAFIGTILFHTLFIVSPMAGKKLFGDTQIGEFFRVFVAYGIIAVSLVLHAWQKLMKKKQLE